MLSKPVLLVVVPMTTFTVANIFRWVKMRNLSARFAQVRREALLTDVDALVQAVSAASEASSSTAAAAPKGEETASTVADDDIVTVTIHGVNQSYRTVKFPVRSIASWSWSLDRLYDLYCAMWLTACNASSASHPYRRWWGRGAGRCYVHNDKTLIYSLVNTWNVFCVVANAQLSDQVDNFDELKKVASMCMVVLGRYDIRRLVHCDDDGIYEGSLVTRCCYSDLTLFVSCIDPLALAQAKSTLQTGSSKLQSSLLFIQTVFRVCSYTQLAAVGMVVLLGDSAVSRMLARFAVSGDISLGDIAARQASLTSDQHGRFTPFLQFAQAILLGLPGKALLAKWVADTVKQILETLRNGITSNVFSKYNVAITADTVIALSRRDYHSEEKEAIIFATVLDALEDLTSLDSFVVDVPVEMTLEAVRHTTNSLIYPLEVLTGWVTMQYGVHTLLQWQRYSVLSAHLKAFEVQRAREAAHSAKASPHPMESAELGTCRPSAGLASSSHAQQSLLYTERGAVPHFGLTMLLLSAVDAPARTEQNTWTIILHSMRVPRGPASFVPSSMALCRTASRGTGIFQPLSRASRRHFARAYSSLHALSSDCTVGAHSLNSRGTVQCFPEDSFSAGATLAGLDEIRAGGWEHVLHEAVNADTVRVGADVPAGNSLFRLDFTWEGINRFMNGLLINLVEEIPQLVMVAASTMYPSRLLRLRPAEAMSVPAELSHAIDQLPLYRGYSPWQLSLDIAERSSRPRKASQTPFSFDKDVTARQYRGDTAATARAVDAACQHQASIDHLSWDQAAALPDGPWAVEFCDVSFRYPSSATYVLRNVSFAIPKGGLLGIIGFSGAGKTTLLLLLARLYAPCSGEITINGIPIDRFPARELRRHIANAWQASNDMRFIEEMSIEANVALGNLMSAGDASVTCALRAAEAWGFVESRGRGRRGKLAIGELSGGELERLNIARGFMKSPSKTGLFLMDECTSAMDSATEHVIMNRLGANLPRGGDTSCTPPTRVVVSHRLSSVSAADEILVLSGGRIVERGTWTQLESNPQNTAFHKLLQSQAITPISSFDKV